MATSRTETPRVASLKQLRVQEYFLEYRCIINVPPTFRGVAQALPSALTLPHCLCLSFFLLAVCRGRLVLLLPAGTDYVLSFLSAQPLFCLEFRLDQTLLRAVWFGS